MAEDFRARFREVVNAASTSAEGLSDILKEGSSLIDEIDAQITRRLADREYIADVVATTAQFRRALTGQASLTDEDWERLNIPPRPGSPEELRKIVMDAATAAGEDKRVGETEEGSTLFGLVVTDSAVLEHISSRDIPLPWANPKAVIGTILNRSGEWKKSEPGVYFKESTVNELPF